MKRLIVGAFALAMAFACTPKYNCVVDFDFDNCPEAQMIIKYVAPDDSNVSDTVAVTGGKAQYKTNVAEPLNAYSSILIEGCNKTLLGFVLEPARIKVKADMNNVADNGPRSGRTCLGVKTVGGRNNAFNAGLKALDDSLLALPKYAEYAKAKAEMDHIGTADMDLYREKSAEMKTKFAVVQADYYKDRSKAICDYVLAHTDCEVAPTMYDAYNRREMTPEEYVEGYNAFPESVKNSYIAKRITAKVAGQKATLPGAVAPDFTLKTPDGSTLTLSSLRGKYCMLDFWGSWCHWCIVGIPTVKRIYSKYSDKMEIVSVDCSDTQEKWLKAIEENGMPWKHVKNEESDMTPEKFAVRGYPTFIVLDPEGKVVKSFLGETDDFESFFDELFAK